MSNNLYDQLSLTEVEAIATLLGFHGVDTGFRVYLREIPALQQPFTIGDAARAYLAHLTEKLAV